METERSPLKLTDLAGNRSDSISQQRDLLSGAEAGQTLPGLLFVENYTDRPTDRRALSQDDSDKLKYVPQEDPESRWHRDGTGKPLEEDSNSPWYRDGNAKGNYPRQREKS